MEFTPRHKSLLAAAFCRVDTLLGEAVHCLDPAVLASPLARHLADASPLQHRVLADQARQMRQTMAALLQRLGVAAPPATASAREAARTALHRALIAVEALAPRLLCAEGPVDDGLAAELNRVVAELLEHIGQMEARLDQCPSELPARPAQTGEEARRLEKLGRTIAEQRLAELQAPLVALAARFAADDVEIALFGAQNSGKSSLINRLLGAELLPTGPLPVTAVPVHIGYGRRTRGWVDFADAISELIPAGRIAEFADAHFNPGNARHVLRFRLQTPAPLLADGVSLVDMPGIEPARGPEVLPCCDLGIVVVDASGALSLDEAATVDRLRRTGTEVLVVLTKADRLSADERWKVYGHVQQRLAAWMGVELPVYLASARDDDAELARDWISRGLAPCLAESRQLRERSLACKLDALEERANTALARRRLRAARQADPATAWQQVEPALVRVRTLLEAARAQSLRPAAEAAHAVDALVAEVAHNAALLWWQEGGRAFDLSSLLAASLEARAGAVARNVEWGLASLRAEAENALAEATAALGTWGESAGELPRPSGLPVFDGGGMAELSVTRPAWALLCRALLRQTVRRALRETLSTAMRDTLAAYLTAVERWRLASLSTLAGQFAETCARLRPRAEEPRPDAPGSKRGLATPWT